MDHKLNAKNQMHLETDATGWSGLVDLDDESVLCGPDGDPGRVVIDDLMAKDWKETLVNLRAEFSIPDSPGVLPQAVSTPLRNWVEALAKEGTILGRQDDGYGLIVELPDDAGIAHLNGDDMSGYRIDGLLLGCDLCVDPSWRNFGIGSMIVAAALLHHEELPTWHHDKPSYSYAGAAAARAGLHIAQQIAQKNQLRLEF